MLTRSAQTIGTNPVSEGVQSVFRVPALVILLLQVPGERVLELVLFDKEQYICDEEDAAE